MLSLRLAKSFVSHREEKNSLKTWLSRLWSYFSGKCSPFQFGKTNVFSFLWTKIESLDEFTASIGDGEASAWKVRNDIEWANQTRKPCRRRRMITKQHSDTQSKGRTRNRGQTRNEPRDNVVRPMPETKCGRRRNGKLSSQQRTSDERHLVEETFESKVWSGKMAKQFRQTNTNKLTKRALSSETFVVNMKNLPSSTRLLHLFFTCPCFVFGPHLHLMCFRLRLTPAGCQVHCKRRNILSLISINYAEASFASFVTNRCMCGTIHACVCTWKWKRVKTNPFHRGHLNAKNATKFRSSD